MRVFHVTRTSLFSSPKRRRMTAGLGVLLGGAVLLNGCGGGALLLGLAGVAGQTLLGALVGAAIKSDDIEVTPSNPVVPVGTRVPFRVEAFSLLGNKIPTKGIRWELNTPAPKVPGTVVGSIDKDSGVFLALSEGQAVVEATVLNLDGVNEGVTVISVDNSVAPQITTLAVYPSKLTIPVGRSLQFLSVATDKSGLPMAAGVAWSVQSKGRQAVAGIIDPSTGVFSALIQGTVTIQAQAGDKTTTAEVTVVPAPDTVGDLAALVVNPPSMLMGPGQTQQFIAHGLDKDGNFLPLADGTWSVEGEVGSIGATGLFTAGATAGTGTVKVTSGEYVGEAALQVHVEDTGSG